MSKAPRRSRGGQLRIVAGSLRGSRLAVPDLQGLRPTPDRVRETLFNWLSPIIEGAHCLDLYAGTGALGIEAISRGARECVFVERDSALCSGLRENLTRLHVDSARVVNDEAFGFLSDAEPQRFDVVFLDPPFAMDLWAESARRLEQGDWFNADARIYVERPTQVAFTAPANWQLQREGHAGAVHYALYRRAATDPLS